MVIYYYFVEKGSNDLRLANLYQIQKIFAEVWDKLTLPTKGIIIFREFQTKSKTNRDVL